MGEIGKIVLYYNSQSGKCFSIVLLYQTNSVNSGKNRDKIMNKTEKKDRKKKQDIILILIVLAAAALLFAGNRLLFSKPPMMVEISVDGNVVETLPLSQDTERTITGYGGGTNRIVIKDGKVCAAEATCPDKICVNQGWIGRTGENIVCLPNRMIARITGGE